MTQWYFYEMSPIDQLWEMLPTPEEVARKLIDSSDDGPEGGITSRLSEFIRDYDRALAGFKKRGWEGDFRGHSRVFWLPEDVDFVYAFVWKQDNNGTTFVVSPRELVWLKEWLVGQVGA